jgi:hypothetical protein
MKKILISLLILPFYLILAKPSFGFSPITFINFINPIRGEEGWELKNQTPLDFPHLLYQESTPSAFPVSWALRYDAVQSATISSNFKQLVATDSSQLLAAFLEITPKQTQDAQVDYPGGDYLLQPQRVFLSGYSQKDRLKLIDTYMEKFYEKFKSYPKTVIAWHIDSYSLEYLSSKYSVTSAVIVDDQYAMDHYRVWGSYFGQPYYPSKLNVLVPTDNPKDRINIVVSKWASRDPFNGFANSLFSFQVNDYPYVGQTNDYFKKLLQLYSQKDFNEFTQVNIGIENDYSMAQYKDSIKETYKILSDNKKALSLNFTSLPDFANWHLNYYPQSSATFTFLSEDITGNESGKVFLYQTPKYRIALKQTEGSTQIIDFRIFNPKEAEAFYVNPNTQKTLYLETHSIIDAVKYKDSVKNLDFDLNTATLTKNNLSATLTADEKTFIFKTDKIIFPDGNIQKISPSFPLEKNKKSLTIALSLLITATILGLFINRKKITKKSLLIISTILITGIIASLTMFRSGDYTAAGLSYWGPNGHDALFHLSFIEHFAKNPLDLANPQIAGQSIKNYHIGFDYLAGLMVRFFHLSASDLYFKILPLLFSVTILILSYKLTQKLKFNKTATIFSLLGIFLTGSLGFLLSLIKGGSLFTGESVFWANQSISILLNPPFTLSLIFLLSFLLILKEKLFLRDYFLLILIGGGLVQIKVYAFLLLCLALLLSRKIKLLIGVGLVGLLFVLPTLKLGGPTPFVFYPLWFPQNMLSSNDRLNWQFLAQALQTYQAQLSWIKIIVINLISITVFILGNLGIRLFGLFYLLKNKQKNLLNNIISIIIIAGIIIPLIFIQNQNPWNTIQFMYYSLFFLSFPTALQITKLAPKKILSLIAYYLLLISLALPTTIGTLRDYITIYPASRVSFYEAWGLDSLSKMPSGIVLSPLYNSTRSKSISEPKSLYGYVSTAYISALTGQTEFLSDTINLDITGFNYQDKANQITKFYQTQDTDWAFKFLKDNNISYVYEIYNQPLKFDTTKANLTKFFDSGEVNIYKVN